MATLEGKTFLDVGCGSGLFSLAARRLGARVHSFDYDPASVQCALSLRDQYGYDKESWNVEQGSILDDTFLKTLNRYDIVYSWGVLHHTGAMWRALRNVVPLVEPSGRLFIAIYDDAGRSSRLWGRIKRAYNTLPRSLRFLILLPAFARLWGPTLLKDLLKGNPLRTWRSYVERRGMSPWHNVVDWVGGYPFEVAKPCEICNFYIEQGFVLKRLRTVHGRACNEYVFESGPANA